MTESMFCVDFFFFLTLYALHDLLYQQMMSAHLEVETGASPELLQIQARSRHTFLPCCYVVAVLEC